MATIRANQLSLVNLGLDEKVMQLLEHLFITLQLLSCWRLARQGGETKLSMTDVGQLTGEKKKEKKKKNCRCSRVNINIQLTSVDVAHNAAQSIRGKMLINSCALSSVSSCTNSASFGWRGKEFDEARHDLTAQVRKFKLRIFIFFLSDFFFSPATVLFRLLIRRLE